MWLLLRRVVPSSSILSHPRNKPLDAHFPSSTALPCPASPPAGKSTVLRSVAAAALLGCCGLLVPSQRALIPFYDSFMIRNFSGDSPMEGLSSFALECVDMK